MSEREELQQLLEAYPVIIETDVAWADMDYFRHVNNTVFFRYFESARIAYLQRIGFAEEQELAGVGPILHSTHCRFRQPLAFPDRVSVGARTVELGVDRFTMEYRLVSHALGTVAADGGGIVVAYHYPAGRKTELPPGVRSAIRALDGIEGS